MNLYNWVKRLTIGICLTSIIVGIFLMVKLKPESVEYTALPGHLLQYLMGQNPTPRPPFNTDKFACKIPKTSVWPEFMKKIWNITKNPDCSQRKFLAQLSDTDQILRVFPKYSKSACCLSQIFRIDKMDNHLNITNCTKILDRIVNVSEMEFLIIKCGPESPNRVSYLANIPMKPIVRFKIDAWKTKEKKSEQVLPFNILVVGIDTVSRSHAYRSIPKTLDLLRKMGFHDFLGYHSVAPSTLSNFMGFLIGLERSTVRESCAPDWSTPFDSCPLIWKNFSRNDYVTMFIEDMMGSFNWGGQSGFHPQPTDYYVHPLSTASADTGFCPSPESNPQFVLRYTKRFIHKFQHTPFFSFSWINYPMHGDMFSLQNYENDTMEFFESLQSIHGFLERTLIVFLSDHGERIDYSESKSGIEAFIERGLPPLFVRFPELLKTRHPELKLDSILEHNVNSLLTPFDLHHTFLHILTLDGGNTTGFEPIRQDRQSLLTRIDSENRNCETVNIPEGNCVCNTNVNSSEDQLVYNQRLRNMVASTLRTELNRTVGSSNYSDVCAQWIIPVGWLSSIRILHKTTNHSDVHVKFSADRKIYESRHGIAKFEANVRVHHTLNRNKTIENFKDCNLIGKISRVSLYGNQSWCVGFKTDKDKEMKEFCLCK